MKRECRLNDSDMLAEGLFPLQEVFNSIRDKAFIKTIRPLCHGTGFGVEFGACTLPGDLDDYDKVMYGSLYGIEFGLHDGQSVVVDYQIFYYYLKKACEAYVRSHPKDKDEIKSIIDEVKAQLGVD